ncbi:MAG: hypothetical protein ABIK33_00355 [candidate division WOR-3 bacterium]
MKKTILLLCLLIGLGFSYNIDYTNWTVNFQIEKAGLTELKVETDIDRTLKSLIKNLQFDNNRTVQDYLNEHSQIARQFDRLRIGARETDIRYLSDGATIYEYEAPLTGQVMKLLMPYSGGGIPITTLCCPICKRPWPEDLAVPEGVKLVPQETEFTPKYTGILIDARDIDLQPCLFPKVLTEDGEEIYSLGFATNEYVTKLGLVSYVQSFDQAFQNERLGINPLRVTALKSSGPNKTDIIISQADAKTMHNSQHNLGLLERCQVVILIGNGKSK